MSEVQIMNANDQVWEDPAMPLALVSAATKERARLQALEAIATPVVLEQKEILLGRARAVTVLEDQAAIPTLVEIASLMKGLKKRVEEGRKQLKEPVLRIGEAIDAVARETVGEIDAEIKRLERLVADFHAEEVRRRQQEALRREEEARRQREEAQAAARAAEAVAEKARQEAAARAAETGGDDLEAALEAELEAEQAEARAAEARAAAAVPIYAAPVGNVTAVKGAAVSTDWDYEVTDIVALYASNPACVELKARPSMIKGVVKAAAQQAAGKEFEIPGLRIFPKVKVATRAR